MKNLGSIPNSNNVNDYVSIFQKEVEDVLKSNFKKIFTLASVNKAKVKKLLYDKLEPILQEKGFKVPSRSYHYKNFFLDRKWYNDGVVITPNGEEIHIALKVAKVKRLSAREFPNIYSIIKGDIESYKYVYKKDCGKDFIPFGIILDARDFYDVETFKKELKEFLKAPFPIRYVVALRETKEIFPIDYK